MIGDQPFILELLSIESQSLLVKKRAFSASDLALDVPDCVMHVLTVNFFANIVNVGPRSATMVVETVQKI